MRKIATTTAPTRIVMPAPRKTKPSECSARSAPKAGPAMLPAFDITRRAAKCSRRVSAGTTSAITVDAVGCSTLSNTPMMIKAAATAAAPCTR